MFVLRWYIIFYLCLCENKSKRYKVFDIKYAFMIRLQVDFGVPVCLSRQRSKDAFLDQKKKTVSGLAWPGQVGGK